MSSLLKGDRALQAERRRSEVGTSEVGTSEVGKHSELLPIAVVPPFRYCPDPQLDNWISGEAGSFLQGAVMMRIQSASELEVYQLAYVLAMEVYRATLSFPQEERYALTSQIRRSSRSVCLNLRESWAKRRYESHFVSKLTDCDGENAETDTALHFAVDCGYLDATRYGRLVAMNGAVGRMLGTMLREPGLFCARGTGRK